MKSSGRENVLNPSDFRIVDEIRQACCDYARAELDALHENLPFNQVNDILSRILARVFLDERVVSWTKRIGLFLIERTIFTRLHIAPYHAVLCTRNDNPLIQKGIGVRLSITKFSSGWFADTPQIFFEPLEFLLEERPGEFVTEGDISQCKPPAGWERRDAVLVPHRGYLKLMSRAFDYWTEMFMLEEDDVLWYSFRAYSSRFDNLIYGQYAMQCLDSLGTCLRDSKAMGVRIRSAFLVPVSMGPQLVSNFLFISERRTRLIDRTALIALAQEITNWYLHAEIQILERRYAVTTASVPSSLLFTHESRNILAAMDGSIRSLKERIIGAQDGSLVDLIRDIDSRHNRVLEKINEYEANVRNPKEAETLLTVRELTESFSILLTKGNYKNIVLVASDPGVGASSKRRTFYLKGNPTDLFQFIETFVQNGLSACVGPALDIRVTMMELAKACLDRYNFIVNAFKIGETTRVLVGIEILTATEPAGRLRIQIKDTGTGISSKVLNALYKESTFARLPSNRIDGGRGLLSAISALHAIYQASCNYKDEEKAWVINIPIRLERPSVFKKDPTTEEKSR